MSQSQNVINITPRVEMTWSGTLFHLNTDANSFPEAIAAVARFLADVRGEDSSGGLKTFAEDVYRALHAVPPNAPVGDLAPEAIIDSVRQTVMTWHSELETARQTANQLRREREEAYQVDGRNVRRIRELLGILGSPGIASTWPDLLSYLETRFQQLKEAAGGAPTPTVARVVADTTATLKENERLAEENKRVADAHRQMRDLVVSAADELPVSHHQMRVSHDGHDSPEYILTNLPAEVKTLRHALYGAVTALARRDGFPEGDSLEEAVESYLKVLYRAARTNGWISVGQPPPRSPPPPTAEERTGPDVTADERTGPAVGFFLCSDCGNDLATHNHTSLCKNAERYPIVASDTQRCMVLRQYDGSGSEQSQVYADHIYLLVASGRGEWDFDVIPDGRDDAGLVRVTIAGVLVGVFNEKGVFDTRASHLVFPAGVHAHIRELATRMYPDRKLGPEAVVTKNPEEPVINFTEEPQDKPVVGGSAAPVPDFKERVAQYRERYIAATLDRTESKSKSLERATRALGSTRGFNSAFSQRRWLDRADEVVRAAEAAARPKL